MDRENNVVAESVLLPVMRRNVRGVMHLRRRVLKMRQTAELVKTSGVRWTVMKVKVLIV